MIFLQYWSGLWSFLSSAQRRQGLILWFLMLTGMALEMVGIGLVMPVLVLLTQTDPLAVTPGLRAALSQIGVTSRGELVFAAMIVLVVIYGLKTIFLAYLAWKQMRFVFDLQSSLSLKLFGHYLAQPYTFHLQRNSAELIRNITTEIQILTHTGLIAALTLTAEFLVLAGISFLLFYLEPFGATLVVVVLGTTGYAFQHLTRHPIQRWAGQRQNFDALRLQHIQQGLSGVKEVKILGCEDEFEKRYHEHNKGSAAIGERHLTLLQFPRLLLEFTAILGLSAIVFLAIFQERQLETLVPTLGLFAAAAFKILPSLNRVLSAFQNARFAYPVIDVLRSELTLPAESRSDEDMSPFVFRHQIKIDAVTLIYSPDRPAALSDVSLVIGHGQTVGFVGQSGAGKTTLIDALLGLLKPSQGGISVDGRNIWEMRRAWQGQIGYVPQTVFLTDDSLRRNIAFGLPESEIDDTKVSQAIRHARLEEFVSSLPEGLATLVGERGVRLSGGQRQRIGIARALYRQPSILVLDEATSALDTNTENQVMEAVRSLHGSITIIIIAHRLSTVRECDYIYRLADGKIVAAGQPAAVLAGETTEGN